MRGRFKKGASPFLEEHPELVLKEIDPKDPFFSNQKLHLEVGSGKGDFVIGMAKKHPDTNFLAIERDLSIAGILAKKVFQSECPNIRVMHGDFDVLYQELENLRFQTIYLNFSDPWPKKRHEKRRLSSKIFLEKYDNIFNSEKKIEMKTDNDDLFEYSTESFLDYGYKIIKCNTNYFDKFTTEYEDKFISKGKNINYISVVKE